jgi:hypothetical protein
MLELRPIVVVINIIIVIIIKYLLGRTYYWSTDSIYLKFVHRNLKDSHRRYACNWWLINKYFILNV